jgi:hypothetical protein
VGSELNLEGDTLTYGRSASAPWERLDVNKDFVSALVGLDESEPALVVPGFQRTGESHEGLLLPNARRNAKSRGDAAAICEAASRPTMRFIAVKSIEQQSMLCVHRLREGIKEDRIACINRIRGLMAEFGLVFPQETDDVLEDAGNELGTLAR